MLLYIIVILTHFYVCIERKDLFRSKFWVFDFSELQGPGYSSAQIIRSKFKKIQHVILFNNGL